MSLQGVWSECLRFHPEKQSVVENSGGRLSSDAGLLLGREFDQRVGLTQQFAAALQETQRDPEHSLIRPAAGAVSGRSSSRPNAMWRARTDELW